MAKIGNYYLIPIIILIYISKATFDFFSLYYYYFSHSSPSWFFFKHSCFNSFLKECVCWASNMASENKINAFIWFAILKPFVLMERGTFPMKVSVNVSCPREQRSPSHMAFWATLIGTHLFYLKCSSWVFFLSLCLACSSWTISTGWFPGLQQVRQNPARTEIKVGSYSTVLR